MVEGLYTNAREEIGGDSDLICDLKRRYTYNDQNREDCIPVGLNWK